MLQLFTHGAPSPRKVSIMLEELALTYAVEVIDVYAAAHKGQAFLQLNPNGRTPTLVETVPGQTPVVIWESLAILIYLAETRGRLLPADGRCRYEVLKWATFQASHAPYLGNAHWYRLFAPHPEPYLITRFADEAARIYRVLDQRLSESPYIGGDDYSIADISFYPWIEYHDWQAQSLVEFPQVARWFAEVGCRPAVQRGRAVPYPCTEFGVGRDARDRRVRIQARLADVDWSPSRIPPQP